jgi:hypothetical protein
MFQTTHQVLNGDILGYISKHIDIWMCLKMGVTMLYYTDNGK